MNPLSGRLLVLAGSLVCAVIPGCVGIVEPPLSAVQARVVRSGGTEVTAQNSLFYPLDIGNHWEYERKSHIVVIPTGGPPGDPLDHVSDKIVNLTGTAEQYGREYVVQHESIREDDIAFDNDYLYRQDASGLFSADPPAGASATAGRNDAASSAARERIVNRLTAGLPAAYRAAALRVLEKQRRIREIAFHAAQPAARVGHSLLSKATPGGPLEGEIALLVYPLHPHDSWHVREDPLVVYTVEGHENLKLAAGNFQGFRIRIDWPGVFRPGDLVHVWFGRDGYLQLEVHVTGDAVDQDGNVIGTVISDESESLRALSLVGGRSQRP